MASESSTQSITVNAPRERVATVITDFTAYPEWVSAVKTVEIIKNSDDPAIGDTNIGLASQVRFHLDAGVLRDEYVLSYQYQHDSQGKLEIMSWELISSNAQKSQRGSYQLADTDNNTTKVTYSLFVELNIPMLGMFRRKAERIIMDTALRELKKRVEQG